MKTLKIIVIIVGIVVVTLVAVQAFQRHNLVNASLIKVSSASSVQYRRGDCERKRRLDSSAKEHINAALEKARPRLLVFTKSVGRGGLFFIDEHGTEVLHVSAFKGNIVRIDDSYFELDDDILTVSGFGDTGM